jgi:DNA-binding transcriptional LysR family regulator
MSGSGAGIQMNYDLTALDILIAVAEDRNLTKAARRKYLAVSAT